MPDLGRAVCLAVVYTLLIVLDAAHILPPPPRPSCTWKTLARRCGYEQTQSYEHLQTAEEHHRTNVDLIGTPGCVKILLVTLFHAQQWDAKYSSLHTCSDME